MSSPDKSNSNNPVANSTAAATLPAGLSPATKAGGKRIPAAHPHVKSEAQREEELIIKQDLLEHQKESMEHQKYEIEAARNESPKVVTKNKVMASNYNPVAQKVTYSSNKVQNHQLQQPGGNARGNNYLH